MKPVPIVTGRAAVVAQCSNVPVEIESMVVNADVIAEKDVLPNGWEARLVPMGETRCVEMYDAIAAMYASASDDSHRFCADLVRFGLVDHPTLEERINALPIDDARKRSIVDHVHYHFAMAAC